MEIIIAATIKKPSRCSPKGSLTFMPQIEANKVRGIKITEKIVRIFIVSLVFVVSKDWFVFSRAKIVSLWAFKVCQTFS